MTYPTQGVNDDEFFAQLVSGEFTGRRESFIHISPASPQWIFGFVVTKLYLISSQISWYYLILLLTVVLALTYMTVLISKNSHILIKERIILLVMSFLFLLWFVPSPTYTSTAFITSLAGIFGFALGIKNRIATRDYIVTSFFLTWGMSIRTESFYATLFFFIPTMVLWLFITKRIKQLSGKKVLAIATLPAIVFSLNMFMDFNHFSKPDWKEYRIFNESRYAIQGNEIERVVSENPMDYGWTETEFNLFESYNFVSFESFSGGKLKDIVNKYDQQTNVVGKIKIVDIQKRWSTYFVPFYSVIYLSLLMILYFVTYFIVRRQKSTLLQFLILISVSFILNIILVFAITVFLRLPERIVFPIAFFFPMMVLLVVSLLERESNKFVFSLQSLSTSMSIFVASISLLWPSINHLYSLKINPAYSSFWRDQKMFFQEIAEDKVLVGNASQFKSIWSNPYFKNNSPSDLSIYPLGWYTFSPYWIQRGKLLGVNEKSVGKEFLDNSDIYWVSDEAIVNDLVDLVSKEYSAAVGYKKIGSRSFDYGEYNIYSIVEKR
jgi:hypothetical protein